MIYCLVMLLFLTVHFDASEGVPGDCDFSDTAGTTRCKFFCSFSTTWTYCHDNICCCGYNDGHLWQAFRVSERGGCRDDPPLYPPKPADCIDSECQAACGDADFDCDGPDCYCLHPAPDGTPAYTQKVIHQRPYK